MEDFFDKLQDKILIIDYSGRILFCNKILLNQLQYELDDLDNIYNLIIDSKIKFDTIDINCKEEYLVDILTKNNSTIPFKLNLSFSSFNNSDSILSYLASVSSSLNFFPENACENASSNAFCINLLKTSAKSGPVTVTFTLAVSPSIVSEFIL